MTPSHDFQQRPVLFRALFRLAVPRASGQHRSQVQLLLESASERCPCSRSPSLANIAIVVTKYKRLNESLTLESLFSVGPSLFWHFVPSRCTGDNRSESERKLRILMLLQMAKPINKDYYCHIQQTSAWSCQLPYLLASCIMERERYLHRSGEKFFESLIFVLLFDQFCRT